MRVPEVNSRFHEERIPIDRILLDPNNPRLLDTSFETVPEERVGEDGVQRETLRRLNEGGYDLDGLRDSIRRSGLLSVDRIVIRPYPEGRFVVVEGNRRVGAAKSLLHQHDAGTVTLDVHILEQIRQPLVLVLDSEPAQARLDQWLIQGIRHITGIRPWGAYQAARTIQTMMADLGYTEREVVEALSFSVQRVRRSLRVLAALDQMQEDEEFGEFAQPDLYSFFDEAIRRVSFRQWLGWDDDAMRFESADHLAMFYAWITPDDQFPEGRSRIARAEDIRNIDAVVENSAALAVLNTPGKTFAEAHALATPTPEPDWRRPLALATEALRSIPINVLEELSLDDRQLLEALRDTAARRLEIASQIGRAL